MLGWREPALFRLQVTVSSGSPGLIVNSHDDAHPMVFIGRRWPAN